MQNDEKINKSGVWYTFAACLVISLLLLLMLGGFFTYLEDVMRSKVSRMKSAMRTVEEGLEAYHIDTMVYPPGRPYTGLPPSSLTTPIAFLIQLPIDVYNVTHEEMKRWHEWRLVSPWLASFLTLCFALLAFLHSGASVGMKTRNVITTAVCILPAYFLLTALILKLTIKGGEIKESVGAVLALWAAIVIGVILSHCLKLAKAYHYTLLSGLMIAMSLVGLVLYTGAFWQPDPESHQSFTYVTDGQNGWVLISYGPDRKLDTPIEQVFSLDIPLAAESRELLDWILPYTYDATNGTVSSGDIWRVKQAVRKPE
jgi:hypothetical protein